MERFVSKCQRQLFQHNRTVPRYACCSMPIYVAPQSVVQPAKLPTATQRQYVISYQTAPLCTQFVNNSRARLNTQLHGQFITSRTMAFPCKLWKTSQSSRHVHMSSAGLVRQSPYSNFGHKRKGTTKWSYFYSLFLTTLLMAFFGFNGFAWLIGKLKLDGESEEEADMVAVSSPSFQERGVGHKEESGV